MFQLPIIDPFIASVSIFAILAIVLGLLLKRIKQPYIIGYIFIGILLGQHGLGIIENDELIHHFGEIGIVLLLFFIGMETKLPEFIKQWKVAVIGTSLQVLASIGVMVLVGYFIDWQLKRSIVIGFVIALSSSAVIIKLLDDKGLMNTKLGKNVLSILLTQDMIMVPLLIITTQLGGSSEPLGNIILKIIGGLLIIGTLAYIYVKQEIKLPYSNRFEKDHELQVFFAILLCFGGALLTSIFGISAALGAFVGGMVMDAAKATNWLHHTLHSFRVLFVSFFFISIGLQIDLLFIYQQATPILLCLLAVYLTNHLFNTLILRMFSRSWYDSFIGGALLAQIGELSFLLSFSAWTLGIIGEFGYKFTISLISLTLIISPFWIGLSEQIGKAFKKSEPV